MTEDNKPKAGLEKVVAGQTAVSKVVGDPGALIYRGYNIHDLTVNSNFEETIFLLWYGRLPLKDELETFTRMIAAESLLPDEVKDALRGLPRHANPMSLLRTGVSILGLCHPEESAHVEPDAYVPGHMYMGQLTPEGPGFLPDHVNSRKAERLMGRMVPLVAAIQRHIKGEDFVDPLPGKGVAFNFLRCLNGVDPDEETEKIFDKCLILHADHGFNASTFAARVASGTLTDVHSAMVAAVCTLKGHLHGGANTKVMESLIEIGDANNVETWVKNALEERKKIMGIGHRVYKGEDPRATHLRTMSETLCKKTGNDKWWDISKKLEDMVWELKGIKPNVDFYSASTYYCLGIDPQMYTPIFALSRTSGWLAHILEQLANNRLIRPASDYVGNWDLSYVPIQDRKIER